MPNQAAWLTGKGQRPLKLASAPMPEPKADEITLKVHAVAMNPADPVVQNTGLLVTNFPYVGGCDAAGQITAVGSAVESFQVGDRVLATINVFGNERPNVGTFQLYFATKASLAAKLPEHISYTDGCVLPLGLTTAASCIFAKDTMALDYPQLDSKPNGKVLVVWGASSVSVIIFIMQRRQRLMKY